MLLPLFLLFVCGFLLIIGVWPLNFEERPKLQIKEGDQMEDYTIASETEKKVGPLRFLFSKIAIINTKLAFSPTGRRIYKSLSIARTTLTVEEFFLIKELLVVVFTIFVFNVTDSKSSLFIFWVLMGAVTGYMLPEVWLSGRVKKIKGEMLKFLPDTVDLLGLCVNAGLDFMMALKYVVERSSPTVVTYELRNMMQEINVGKPRREALRDLAKKYELPDLSTFSRTLIQADRMGTSVTDALNMLSDDMRDARFRRGEAMALKAPLKMLVPLLFFIFPVVAILVAGPVFLDFFQNNPLKGLSH